MDDGLGTKALSQPQVEGQVVVGGFEIGGVVVEGGIGIVATAGLDTDEDVAKLEAGDGEGELGG
jgi:hypothetical protein